MLKESKSSGSRTKTAGRSVEGQRVKRLGRQRQDRPANPERETRSSDAIHQGGRFLGRREARWARWWRSSEEVEPQPGTATLNCLRAGPRSVTPADNKRRTEDDHNQWPTSWEATRQQVPSGRRPAQCEGQADHSFPLSLSAAPSPPTTFFCLNKREV